MRESTSYRSQCFLLVLWTRPRIEQNHRQTAGTSRDRKNMVFFAQNQINILYDFFEQSISFLKDGKCFKDSKWSGLGISRPLRRSHSVSTESRKSIVLNIKKIQNLYFCDTCCYFISKCSSNVSIHSITINSVYFDDWLQYFNLVFFILQMVQE